MRLGFTDGASLYERAKVNDIANGRLFEVGRCIHHTRLRLRWTVPLPIRQEVRKPTPIRQPEDVTNFMHKYRLERREPFGINLWGRLHLNSVRLRLRKTETYKTSIDFDVCLTRYATSI